MTKTNGKTNGKKGSPKIDDLKASPTAKPPVHRYKVLRRIHWSEVSDDGKTQRLVVYLPKPEPGEKLVDVERIVGPIRSYEKQFTSISVDTTGVFLHPATKDDIVTGTLQAITPDEKRWWRDHERVRPFTKLHPELS